MLPVAIEAPQGESTWHQPVRIGGRWVWLGGTYREEQQRAMDLTTQKTKLRRAAIVVVLVCGSSMAFAAGATASTPSGEASDSCGRIDFAPQSDNVAFDIRTQGVSCTAARAVAAASRPKSLRPGADHSYAAQGFFCRGQFIQPRGKDYEHYVCARGSERVVFDRG